MHLAALLLLLAAPSADPAPSAYDVAGHGIHVAAPDGWIRSVDGTTVVFDSPEKQASVRIDTFEKETVADPQDCLDIVIKKLTNGDKAAAETY